MADVNLQVQELYVAYFNRPADVAGLAYWSGILAASPDAYPDIVRSFSLSLEYWTTFTGMDNRQVVDAVYQHLFGRAGETAGIDYWAGLLERKALTVANVVTAVADGALGKDKVVIDGRVAVATAFTQHLDLPLEQQLYAGSFANKIAADYLATIVDGETAASALLPANIDAAIASLGSLVLTPHAQGAQVVGVPPLHA
jgi:hypothetical protein